MKVNKLGLGVLTTSGERAELRAIGVMRKRIKLVYRGSMAWAKQYGIDARLWDVVEPVLPTYDYSSGGYPTLSVEGLRERGII